MKRYCWLENNACAVDEALTGRVLPGWKYSDSERWFFIFIALEILAK